MQTRFTLHKSFLIHFYDIGKIIKCIALFVSINSIQVYELFKRKISYSEMKRLKKNKKIINIKLDLFSFHLRRPIHKY